MEKRRSDYLAFYQPPSSDIWTGRPTKDLGRPAYYYQAIQTIDVSKMDFPTSSNCLIGYACDEGVRRNLGRIGAKEGPNAIRKQLTKLPYHLPCDTIYDLGDISINNELEKGQVALGHIVAQVIQNGSLPIVLGGGHDIAFGHFLGIYEALFSEKPTNIGIINFDAHLDLRPYPNGSHSGSPFMQIHDFLQKEEDVFHYMAIGIQSVGNTFELYDNAKRTGTNIISLEECQTNPDKFRQRLEDFMSKVDHIYVTIDLDGFPSSLVKGVSAPSPLGLKVEFVFDALKTIMESKKLRSLDIAEMNPKFDGDHQTAKLAALLIDHVLRF